MNTWGHLFRVTTFGESHGPAMGAIIDGCPAGVSLTHDDIQAPLDRRRPGQSSITTARAEPDRAEVISGVFEDKTLGTPITVVVRNQNQRSQDYDALRVQERKGHADAVWRDRYVHRDHRGGGRTSGRETLSRVIGGAIAEALFRRDLPALSILAWVSQVGPCIASSVVPTSREAVDAHPTRCPDPEMREAMSSMILQAKADGDSYGGAIDLIIDGLPRGLGEPVFGKLKAQLAGALASIGAVTGIVWGAEDPVATLCLPGSAFHARDDVYGGIQGGLATGDRTRMRVYFKPPATLADHAKQGRHDPCILPRAVPVVESMCALVIADLWLQMQSRSHGI